MKTMDIPKRVNWRNEPEEMDPDDEVLEVTPPDVVAALGFDPLEFEDEEEAEIPNAMFTNLSELAKDMNVLASTISGAAKLPGLAGAKSIEWRRDSRGVIVGATVDGVNIELERDADGKLLSVRRPAVEKMVALSIVDGKTVAETTME